MTLSQVNGQFENYANLPSAGSSFFCDLIQIIRKLLKCKLGSWCVHDHKTKHIGVVEDSYQVVV